MAWLTGWSKRQKLTIDHSKIDSDCSNFPVKVIAPDSNAIFDTAQSDGDDVRFTSSDGETLLKHEREMHQLQDTPTGYVNATYETAFNGTDEFYSLPSAANLHKPYQVLEVEFTADKVDAFQVIVYLEMADKSGASAFSMVKVRTIRFGISNTGKLWAFMQCSNTGTVGESSIMSSASLSADTKYVARLEIDHYTKTFELFLNGQSQGTSNVNHAQMWSDVANYIWCDLAARYDYHSTLSTNHALYFDGTIHSYDLKASNYLNASVHHVKIPTVSSTSATEFYMYYGKADAEDGSTPNDVWDSDYKLVMHMDDALEDSTSNGNDGTNYGSTLKLASDGYYRSFNGSNQYIIFPTLGFFDGAGQFTLELKYSQTNGGTQQIICLYGENQLQIQTGENQNDDILHVRGNINSAWIDFVLAPAHSYNTPYVAAATYHPTNGWVLARNGASLDTDNTVGTIGSRDRYNVIGARRDTSVYDRFFNGSISEVRISSTTRTLAWHKATYNSLANTLLSFGGEESLTPTAKPRVMVVWA